MAERMTSAQGRFCSRPRFELINRIEEGQIGTERYQRRVGILRGPSYWKLLPGPSLHCPDSFSEFRFINAARCPHLEKAVQDLDFRHRVELFNQLDERRPEVLKKFLTLIHTADFTTALVCFPHRELPQTETLHYRFRRSVQKCGMVDRQAGSCHFFYIYSLPIQWLGNLIRRVLWQGSGFSGSCSRSICVRIPKTQQAKMET